MSVINAVISVDTSELDEAIEKANKLNDLLKESTGLINDLTGKEKATAVTVTLLSNYEV